MTLKSTQKKRLRALAHHLKPLVTVAGKGLSDSVVAEIERALDNHELVKVKLRGERAERKTWQHAIAERCQAELVQSIGQVACFYRRNPDNPVIDAG